MADPTDNDGKRLHPRHQGAVTHSSSVVWFRDES